MQPVSDPGMPWPKSLPDDLRHRLESVMGYRCFGPSEVWDAVREWLEAEGVEPPLKGPLNDPDKGL